MNADRWGQLTDSVRDFLDSGIRRILGGVTVDPITGYEYIFSQIREIFIMAVCGACIDNNDLIGKAHRAVKTSPQNFLLVFYNHTQTECRHDPPPFFSLLLFMLQAGECH